MTEGVFNLSGEQIDPAQEAVNAEIDAETLQQIDDVNALLDSLPE